MSKLGDTLDEEEVRQIRGIIEVFRESTLDYLQLEIGTLKLTIGKAGVPLPVAQLLSQTEATQPATTDAAPSASPSPHETGPKDDGSVEIVAPMIGRFYSQPEPGAAPYVKLGSQVEKDSTVGLVEAMKVYNAVHAGVDGVITEICVQDGSLVQYGQVLFRVRPT